MSLSKNIKSINRIYFGSECDLRSERAERNFLLDDFNRAMKALIEYEVFTRSIVYHHEHNEKAYLALANTRDTFLLGLTVRLRLFTRTERRKKTGQPFDGKPGTRTGGDFIDDLCELTENDFYGLPAVSDARAFYAAFHKKASGFRDRKRLRSEPRVITTIVRLALTANKNPLLRGFSRPPTLFSPSGS